MSTFVVVDARSRKLAAYAANVTRAEAGLVVRLAVDLGDLRSLVDKGWLRHPVLILGAGYRARSSAGFVSLRGDGELDSPLPVVGLQPLGAALKNVRPIEGRVLWQGVELKEVKTFDNSNWGTANAVLDTLDLLPRRDGQVTIAEGQSDAVGVYTLMPCQRLRRPARRGDSAEREEMILISSLDDIDSEHRVERFTREEVVARAEDAIRRRHERLGSLTPYEKERFFKDRMKPVLEILALMPGSPTPSDLGSFEEEEPEWEREILAPIRELEEQLRKEVTEQRY